MENHIQAQGLQIYPTTSGGVSQFWKEKYETNARKYWDIFYKRHQDKFFKDRHYVGKEFGKYLSGAGKKVILEVGCGAGNTIFPLISEYPDFYVYACDFSPRAIDLVKMHGNFSEARIKAFVCDLTTDELHREVLSSVDIVTMVFFLSAVSPEKMSLVLQNIRKVLKPNGRVLFRDYATGDLAQERFTTKGQKIGENYYVRGDGTRSFYFSSEFLKSLFQENGFSADEFDICCKEVENRSRKIVMNRRWIQAVFRSFGCGNTYLEKNTWVQDQLMRKEKNKNAGDSEIDLSEGVGADMFCCTSSNEIIEVRAGELNFRIMAISKENQHTCRSTGLILWESARLMASVLEGAASVTSGKRVLELGCGCAGICAMAAAKWAKLVVATDGDAKALEMLAQNIKSNLKPYLDSKLILKKLKWGNMGDIARVKEVSNGGFDIILGTDVTYMPVAIMPLFATAKELITSADSDGSKPCLILCHVYRRVYESSIISAASQYKFVLSDQWHAGKEAKMSSRGIISSWFTGPSREEYHASSAVHIMYFSQE